MADTLSLHERPRLAEMTCVCCHCRRERSGANEWHEHTPRLGERLTHGICPACLLALYPDLAPLVRADRTEAWDE